MMQSAEQRKSHLSDNEGSILATVFRHQPITTYRVIKHYEGGADRRYNTSPGQVYPAMRRLSGRGLLDSERHDHDLRGTLSWTITRRGRYLLKSWLHALKETPLLPVDPLGERMHCLDLLPYRDRLTWLTRAKQALRSQLSEIEAKRDNVTCDYEILIAEGIIASTIARIDWLDRAFVSIVQMHNNDTEAISRSDEVSVNRSHGL